MKKIELTLAPTYLSNWSTVDAVRELYQNAIDQQTMNPSSTAWWHYDADVEALYICSDNSELTTQSLLLGVTNKATEDQTIGQFGEGYKVATLVLLREGKDVVFYNNRCKEVWKPRFVKSKRFDTDILAFFIESMKKSSSANPDALIIKISGISSDEFYNQIVPTNLHLQAENKDYTVLLEHEDFGRVLDIGGKVYVNGLYVCECPVLKYGYDFKPSIIPLDRDRQKVSVFDVTWESSAFWSTLANTEPRSIELLADLILNDYADIDYLLKAGPAPTGSTLKKLSDAVYDQFYEAHKDDEDSDIIVPMTYTQFVHSMPKGYVPEFVSDTCYKFISACDRYKPIDLSGLSSKSDMSQKDEDNADCELYAWFKKYRDLLPNDAWAEFDKAYSNFKSKSK